MQGFDVVILLNWGCAARSSRAGLLRAARAASSRAASSRAERERERQEAREAAWLSTWLARDARKRQLDAREASWVAAWYASQAQPDRACGTRPPPQWGELPRFLSRQRRSRLWRRLRGLPEVGIISSA